MTIDEAIEEEKFLAERYQKDGAFDSAVAHAEIADMLRRVRGADEATQRFTTKIRELEDENAQLRELVQYICDENYGDYWFDVKANKLGISAHY